MWLKWIKLCLLALTFCIGKAEAQVVNTERLRLNADSNGWFGDADLAFSFIKVNNPLFRMVMNGQTVFRQDHHQVFFVGNMQLIKSPGQSFANSGFFHTRYQNPADKRLMFEAFHQAQYNRLLKVKFRNLLGAGGRLELLDTANTNKLFLGATLMHEYEVLDGEEKDNNDLRWSYYIAHRVKLFDRMAWNGTMYYQPLLGIAADYRLSLENAILVDITSQIQFKFDIQLFYDSRPPVGVTKDTYAVTNGIRYKFRK
ncbi:MAG: DUF481 domain-containing protein [Bacteroidetes bacterium]|nr:MAG: DUF481 domain-containing protein [Bacteroidota bacterium]